MNDGFLNEYKISKKLNGRKVSELNYLYREMIKELYGNLISGNSEIKCYVDKCKKKYDIVIEIKGIKKYIGIKKGSKNSVHVETLKSFIIFLKYIGVNKDIINKYLHYHYADGTYDGSGTTIPLVEYNNKYSNNIDDINEMFVAGYSKFINRFVFKGIGITNKRIDGLIHGTDEYFDFYTRKEIKEVLDFHKKKISTGVHVSSLFIGPLSRCLNGNEKYKYAKDCIQVKWYNIFDDNILYIMDKEKDKL